MATLRLPMTYPLEFRSSSTDKGSKMVNCYSEKDGTNSYAIKRPGLKYSGVSFPAGIGQGIFNYKDKIVGVINNSFYNVTGTTPALVSTLEGATNRCYFNRTANDGYLFFHKKDKGYVWDGTTFTKLSASSVGFVNVTAGGTGYVSVPSVTFSAPPSGITATGTAVLTSGIVTDIIITNVGSGYVSAPTVTIAAPPSGGTQATAASVLNGFPAGNIVPGTVYLDGYTFVMTEDAKIWNSAINNPLLWDPLDFITSEAEPDKGVAIAKQFNYLVAFGQWSTEFFYDSGNVTGSPLLPNQTMRIEFGCANGDSVAQMEQTIIWVGVGKTTGRVVLMLDGTRPEQMSDASVERILNNSTLQNVRSYSVKVAGHFFYVLNLIDDNITLVLDVKTKEWVIWTSYVNNVETYFDGVFYTYLNNTHWTLDNDNGRVYNISETETQDDSGAIQFRIRTPLFDAESTKRKFLSRLEVVGDKIPSVLRIRFTDNDYQSWSDYRTVLLDDTRSVLYQNGSFRRRAYEFYNNDDVPLRLNYCELELEPGNV